MSLFQVESIGWHPENNALENVFHFAKALFENGLETFQA